MPLISSLGIMNPINFGLTNSLKSPEVVFGLDGTYIWTSAGFSTKYAAPATPPVGTSRGVDVNKGNTAVAFATDNDAICAYPFSTTTGYGAKYSGGAAAGTSLTTVKFNNSNSVLFYTLSVVPYIGAYNWSNGFGTKITNPSTLPTGAAYFIAVHPTDTVVGIGHTNTPFMSVYAFSGGSFGTKFADPSVTAGGNTYGLTFNNAGTVIVGGRRNSPYVYAYAWSSGFGTKYANPATLLTGNGQGVCFNNTDSVIAVAYIATPYVAAYAWSSGFGAKFTDPATVPGTANIGAQVSFNKNGTAIGLATQSLGDVYAWSSGFGIKYTNPAAGVGNYGLVFSN